MDLLCAAMLDEDVTELRLLPVTVVDVAFRCSQGFFFSVFFSFGSKLQFPAHFPVVLREKNRQNSSLINHIL